MGRIITVALTLGVLSFLAYKAVYSKPPPVTPQVTPQVTPLAVEAKPLGNATTAAKRIEAADQKYVDEAAAKSAE